MSVFYTYFIYYFCLWGSEGGFLTLEQYKVVRIRFSCPVKLKTSTPICCSTHIATNTALSGYQTAVPIYQ